ncbi:MAG: fatty acid--CoA ligase family protein, partial [Sulfitobacter sp.]
TPAAVLMTCNVSDHATAHANRMQAKLHMGAYGEIHAISLVSNPDEGNAAAVILYTTGTTGDPKGVMLSHKNLRFAGMASAGLRRMTRDDLIYGVLPISHVFGLASIVVAASFAGARIHLEPRFSAATLYSALNSGVTLFSAVPQMHALLMQYTKEQGHGRLNSDQLRYVSSGAAPLDPAWKRKAEAFYGVALQNGYGMTESTAGICATFNVIGSSDVSVGPPLPGVEVRIDITVAGARDGMGEVLTRGDHVMPGYYRNASETAQILDADGWLRTGDLGRMDTSGHLHILGRSKELIIHGGFNVYPPQVEAALNDHPQVIQSAVIGRMVKGDEKVVAFVQVAAGDDLSAATLQAHVRRRLAAYNCPSQIIIATNLPAAPTGKILKHRLLRDFRDQLD